MTALHAIPVRGLLSAPSSPQFQGRFGRMFRALPAASFGATEQENTDNLKLLGNKMSADFDPPKNEPDDEESGIPALYTYFGQFIDHDLTFDPSSSLQKQNDPNALLDYRNPAFDLDNVYGRGPDDQPYMYEGDEHRFQLGDHLNGGSDRDARDLPRNRNGGRALIGDPRNDENAIVSQLQGLFLRFHNNLLRDNPGVSFQEIQQLMRWHYQYVRDQRLPAAHRAFQCAGRAQDRRPVGRGQTQVLHAEERGLHAGRVFSRGVPPRAFHGQAGLSAERWRSVANACSSPTASTPRS